MGLIDVGLVGHNDRGMIGNAELNFDLVDLSLIRMPVRSGYHNPGMSQSIKVLLKFCKFLGDFGLDGVALFHTLESDFKWSTHVSPLRAKRCNRIDSHY